MISTATVHSFAERKTKNLFGMRPAWLKKDTTADAAAAAAVEAAHAPPSSLLASPDSPRIKELASAAPGKPKALSRTRVRELLTIAMIRPLQPPEGLAAGVSGPETAAASLPTFEEFLKHICRRTRTPLTCMCLALLYLTRLRANHPRSRGSPGSSYRLALSSLCVATKYLYDDAYHTCSWVQVSMGLFSQREVNQMEMEFMYFLHYQLGVTPTEWNQWVATLEAKLVARWSEKGKADVIYGFGLFLSYECCEPDVQEAVRDVAWGEGGRSLLSLLTNAIHFSSSSSPSSNGGDAGKSSPSADSAVSELTCLPTPDPSSWFRIRSPAPSATANQQSATVVNSTSITPITAHFPSSSSSQPLRTTYSRHSFVEQDTGSGLSPLQATHKPFASSHAQPAHNNSLTRPHNSGPPARRSSQCSVAANAALSLHPHLEYSDDFNQPSNLHVAGHRHSMYDPCKGSDWKVPSQQHHQQRMSFMGSAESTAASNMYGARLASTSPFDSFSGDTGGASFLYSTEPRDGVMTNLHAPPASSRKTTSTQHQQQQQQSTGFCAQGPRSMSSGNSAHGMRASGSNVSFDRKPAHGQTASSKLSSGSTVAVGAASRDIPRPVTYNGLGDLNYANSNNGQATGKDAHRPATSRRTPGAASVTSSRNGSPGVGGRNVRYYSNGGVGNTGGQAAAAQGCGGPTASAKSSSSSLKTGNNGARRQSWRHSHRGSGTSSFAQKLRSFAVFNWSAGSGGSGNSAHSPILNHRDQMVSGSAGPDEDQDMPYADGRHHEYAPVTTSVSGTLGAHTISSRSGSREHDLKRNSCCPSQLPHPTSHSSGFARLTNVHTALETISSPSYDFDIEMTKYVSTQKS
ncbi:hypothetical protein IWW39_003875 [Coemansia spiralis]|uniref:Cyclin N-terminal domain-containing protein n=1 Tax=Coemansia spiralis TaxID=417178 RepID=A0A9W8GE10_9FUNG|nr:hypothetical protein IWW39_003875 [Coemansia spiralis]